MKDGSIDLSVEIGGVKLKNPVLAASGTFGYGEEYGRVGDLGWFGAVITKGTTLRPRKGNPPPRTCETPSGMLNAIGLENPGAQIVVEEKLPYLTSFGVPVIVNISGETYDEFEMLGEIFQGVPGVCALEVNVSCPNVKAGGMAFGVDPDTCYKAVRAVKRAWHGPLFVKLTPQANDIVEVAKAAKEGGATALSLINTLLGMAIDIKNRRPLLGNVTGGLSGPAVKPVALERVYRVFRAVDIPLVGCGGIVCAEDALEFLMAGASAVALGSGLLRDPELPRKITEGLVQYGRELGFSNLKNITGVAATG